MLLTDKIDELNLKIKWKRINRDNFSRLGKNKNWKVKKLIDSGHLMVGRGTYGVLNIDTTGNFDEGLYIGAYCSISSQSTFLLSGVHAIDTLLSYPFDIMYFNEEHTSLTKGSIIVGDDVWIGDQVLVLSGVRIGQGAVIGAGSLVTKDVAPYAVVGGVPAHTIKYRFSADVIQQLLSYDISSIKPDKKIKQLLYSKIDSNNIISVLKKIEESGLIKKKSEISYEKRYF